MQSEKPDPVRRTYTQRTASYPIEFKPMAKYQAYLREKYGFSEEQAAGTMMAIHDPVTLVSERIRTLETHLDEHFGDVNRGIREVKRNQWWHTVGVTVTIVGAAVAPYIE